VQECPPIEKFSNDDGEDHWHERWCRARKGIRFACYRELARHYAYKSRTPLPWCNVHQIRLRYPDPTGEYTGFSEEKKQFAGDEFAEIGAEVPEYNGPLLTEEEMRGAATNASQPETFAA